MREQQRKRRKIETVYFDPKTIDPEIWTIIFSFMGCCFHPILRLTCKTFKSVCDSGSLERDPSKCDVTGIFRNVIGPISYSYIGWMFCYFGGEVKGRLYRHNMTYAMMIVLFCSGQLELFKKISKGGIMDTFSERIRTDDVGRLRYLADLCVKYRHKHVIAWAKEDNCFMGDFDDAFIEYSIRAAIKHDRFDIFKWMIDSGLFIGHAYDDDIDGFSRLLSDTCEDIQARISTDFSFKIILDAAKLGRLDFLKLMYERDKHFKGKIGTGSTLAMCSIDSGSAETVDWIFDVLKCDINEHAFIKRGYPFGRNSISRYPVSYLEYALYNNNFEMEKLISQRMDADVSTDTALNLMANDGLFEALKKAVDVGYNLPDDIFQHAVQSGNKDMIRWLIEKGK